MKNSETKGATVENQCLPSNGFMKIISQMRLALLIEQEDGRMESTAHQPLSVRYVIQMENLASFQTGTMFILYQNMEVQ